MSDQALSLSLLSWPSKRAAAGLLAFDRLKQRAEIAFAETDRPAATLDDFKKQRRPGEDAFRKQLEQVALLVVAIDEDLELLQILLVLLDPANTRIELTVVVTVRHIEEFLAHLAHLVDRRGDVGRKQRDVLHAGAV